MSIFSQKQNVTTWRSTSFDSDEKSPASSNFTADAFTKKLGFYGLALIKPGEGRKRKQDQPGGQRDEGKAAAADLAGVSTMPESTRVAMPPTKLLQPQLKSECIFNLSQPDKVHLDRNFSILLFFFFIRKLIATTLG